LIVGHTKEGEMIDRIKRMGGEMILSFFILWSGLAGCSFLAALSSENPDEQRLHRAAFAGDLESVRRLIQNQVGVNTAARDGWTPLHSAAFTGHEAMVALLLENGAAVNKATKLGLTPLHAAATTGHHEIVKLLIAHGADKTVRMPDGERPVDVARRKGHSALIPLLKP
jgi:ankyrin repeat protein